MDTPYQPTGSGKWIWRKPLTRDVVEFGTLPDPRDARIAELEAALRYIATLCDDSRRAIPDGLRPSDKLAEYLMIIGRYANTALMYPEGDMTLTVEDLAA